MSHGTQSGDPQKAALAIIKIEETNGPIPFRLLLGSDTIQTVTKEPEAQEQEPEE